MCSRGGGRASRCTVVATDVDPHMIARARTGRYPSASVRDLPEDLFAAGLERDGDEVVVGETLRNAVQWRTADLRREAEPGPFDLVLCRNLAFTYFDEVVQRDVLDRLEASLRPGGALVIGGHETLPRPSAFALTASPSSCRPPRRPSPGR